MNDASSYLNLPDIETTEHIGRNHMEMCRFTGLDDVEYKKVAAALCRITTMGQPLLGKKQLQKLLDSLRFEQIDARQTNIRKAHAQTCEWLLTTPIYLKWLDPSHRDQHYGFLWIKGKPGAGKSTLMKFVLANALDKTNKKINAEVIVSFFFNARGNELEKSTVGMYRSLLLQLLEQLSERRGVPSSFGLGTFHGAFHTPGIEGLKALLEEVVQELGELPVTCFVDALDECDEGQIRDMISFFEEIGEMTTKANPPINFKVCFSSRHYPYITMKRGLNLALEDQHEHGKDIARYLDSRLKIGHGKLAERIRADVQQKASGVFFWVVLVTEILNKEYDDGKIHKLRQKLQDIPGNLHELFRDILMRDGHNSNELLLCVQWVLFASHPLKPEQLYFAILSGVNPEALSEFDLGEITTAVTERFILSSSKGLVEITKSTSPTVQFIHESVKDFLLKENGLMEIWSDLGGNFEAASHERLKQCCLTYMHIDNATVHKITGSLPTPNTERAAELRQWAHEKSSFLEYATDNALYHANAAEAGGISQAGFLKSFQQSHWIRLTNLFERQEQPLLGRGHADLDIKCRAGRTLLSWATGRGYEGIVRLLLQADQVEVDSKCICGQTPLSQAAKKGHEAIVRLILQTGKVEVNSKCRLGQTPLSWAAKEGHEGTVRLLLQTGKADINSKCRKGRTPLLWAAERGHTGVVQLLLQTGKADINSKCKCGQTPLSHAAERGYEGIVQLLLQRGQVEVA